MCSGNDESSSVHLRKEFVCNLDQNNKMEDLVLFHRIRLFEVFGLYLDDFSFYVCFLSSVVNINIFFVKWFGVTVVHFSIHVCYI